MHKTTRMLITEIALRAVAKTLPAEGPKTVEDMAEAFTNLIEQIIAGVKPKALIATTSYRTFLISNLVLDEIEKEIPIISGKIDVQATITRPQWKEFHEPTVINSNREGGAAKVDS